MLASFESKTIDIGARLRPPADAERRASRIPATVDVAIVGAGIIGLSIGWRLAARGLSVAVFDRAEAGTGTTLASTGMLAAAAEHEAGGDDLPCQGMSKAMTRWRRVIRASFISARYWRPSAPAVCRHNSGVPSPASST